MLLSVIAPVFNEEEVLKEFYARLKSVLSEISADAEILFVNDGSEDRTAEILRELRREDLRIRILGFSRNFGHQAAVKAGVDHARGDALVIMDADLQDPPEIIHEFIAKWKEGYEVVYAVRAHRAGESFFKKSTAALYYRLISKIANIDIPLDTGDFRLIDARVADALRAIKERNPYIRGLISWLGFKQIGIPMNRAPRFAGVTKYSLRKLLGLAWSGITQFSFIPLQLATFFGLLSGLICLLWLLRAWYVTFMLGGAVSDLAWVMAAVLFFGSVQLIAVGIIGAYLARNYDESRSRPLYVLRDKEGF